MIGETAAAVLSRATATDRAMRGVPRAHTPLIVDETPDTMTDTENQFLTLQDVADRLQLKLRTVREHEARGILPASRLGRRVRVSEDQYREYVRRLEARGAGAAVEDLGRSADQAPMGFAENRAAVVWDIRARLTRIEAAARGALEAIEAAGDEPITAAAVLEEGARAIRSEAAGIDRALGSLDAYEWVRGAVKYTDAGPGDEPEGRPGSG